MKQFWMVWNVNGGAPIFRHDYEHQAVTECERLARRSPGETFVVLEATHARKVSDMRTQDLRQPQPTGDDDIPF